jgi:hypothetical protein
MLMLNPDTDEQSPGNWRKSDSEIHMQNDDAAYISGHHCFYTLAG